MKWCWNVQIECNKLAMKCVNRKQWSWNMSTECNEVAKKCFSLLGNEVVMKYVDRDQLMVMECRSENFQQISWFQRFLWFFRKIKSSDHDTSFWNMVFLWGEGRGMDIFSGFVELSFPPLWNVSAECSEVAMKCVDRNAMKWLWTWVKKVQWNVSKLQWSGHEMCQQNSVKWSWIVSRVQWSAMKCELFVSLENN